MSDAPDDLWPWKWLDIDEEAFGELENARQEGHGTWWPFIIGGVLGLILLAIYS